MLFCVSKGELWQNAVIRGKLIEAESGFIGKSKEHKRKCILGAGDIQGQKAALTRLAPDAAIAARNRRPHALSGGLVAKALSRSRRAGEANRWTKAWISDVLWTRKQCA